MWATERAHTEWERGALIEGRGKIGAKQKASSSVESREKNKKVPSEKALSTNRTGHSSAPRASTLFHACHRTEAHTHRHGRDRVFRLRAARRHPSLPRPCLGRADEKRPLVVASFRERPHEKKVTTPSTRTRAVSSDRGGVPSLLPNLEDLAKPFVRAKTTLNEGIASFYDESSGLWEEQWGEHIASRVLPPGWTEPTTPRHRWT